METFISDKNPQTLMKAFNRGTFMCIAKSGLNHTELSFNQNMIAAGSVSQLRKLESFGRENGYADGYTIYHVCSGEYAYEYDVA